ncbi:hypothetical protein HZB08_02485 [Candidatus Saganbacteria bacterium]|uniref:Uncharacterized protein n=1 Tax=Candidatus Saganbacteria bacterium TaxID=2575572 RepID=A0A9D6UMD2_UNCSA|nr:hypothetical protein [Candidatus Saganbacteria bacterium]
MLLVLPSLACASSSIDYENNPKLEEIYRVKIWNLPGGTVEVSPDRGKTWELVGKVVHPAGKTDPKGYPASKWVEGGRVAATAVNAIHIKVSTDAAGENRKVFSLLPEEFIKGNYKSYLDSVSSIYTDIPAGRGIFGGDYAPFVGNPVMLADAAKGINPLPKDYTPELGDKLYIMVERPLNYPQAIIFENSFGGKIIIRYFSGEEKVIGQVLRPVAGVGRFEGTKHASAGRIRANHTGVIDISTSSFGKIGGFQIVPARHGSNLEIVRELSQWMVIGPPPAVDSLEGKAPFFKYFIRPSWGADDLKGDNWEEKLLNRFLVEVKFKGENKWRPMPVYEFNEYYLTGDLPSWADGILSGVSYIRILFPVEEL